MVPGYKILNLDRNYAGKYARVICRSLSAALTDATTHALLLPGKRLIRLKEFSRLNNDETALILKGAPRSLLIPGAVIIDSNWPIEIYKEGVFIHDGRSRPVGTCHITGGVDPEFNMEKLIGVNRILNIGSYWKIRFSNPYPMMPGMRLALHTSDGQERPLVALFPGSNHPVLAKRHTFTINSDIHEIYEYLLQAIGYQNLPPMLYNHAFGQESKLGTWLVRDEILQNLKKILLKLSSKPGGISAAGLAHKNFPHKLLLATADELCNRGMLILRNGWYRLSGDTPLSPFHRSWLEKIRRCGEEGVRIRSMTAPPDIEAMRILNRSELIYGGRTLWLSSDAVDSMAKRIFSGTCTGDTIFISDVKSRISGSRIVALELLRILESQGRLLLQKDGVTRMVK